MARPGRDDDHDEEVRFALVLNGRVSLAIWMGGVTPEIDRLTRTRPGADSGHERVLDLVQARARADVIAGTSAGGINGGFLALGQAYEYSEMSGVRDLWAFKGSFTALLRSPVGSRCRRCCAVTATSCPSCARPFEGVVYTPGSSMTDPSKRPVDMVLNHDPGGAAPALRRRARAADLGGGAPTGSPSRGTLPRFAARVPLTSRTSVRQPSDAETGWLYN
jgi:hypothetical protein